MLYATVDCSIHKETKAVRRANLPGAIFFAFVHRCRHCGVHK